MRGGWLPESDADRTVQVAIVDSVKIKISRLAKGKKHIGLDVGYNTRRLEK